jgi:hypothetical protein
MFRIDIENYGDARARDPRRQPPQMVGANRAGTDDSDVDHPVVLSRARSGPTAFAF